MSGEITGGNNYRGRHCLKLHILKSHKLTKLTGGRPIILVNICAVLVEVENRGQDSREGEQSVEESRCNESDL